MAQKWQRATLNGVDVLMIGDTPIFLFYESGHFVAPELIDQIVYEHDLVPVPPSAPPVEYYEDV